MTGTITRRGKASWRLKYDLPRDAARGEGFAAGHDAGALLQKRCDYLDPALPWTGMRDSGKGSTLSRHGFHHLTRRKAIHFRDSPG